MNYDVLISGGGIGGLLLGHRLAQSGICVCVIEQVAKPSHVYKGELLQPKSLAILKNMGLLSKIEKIGQKIHDIHLIEIDDGKSDTLTKMKLSYDQLAPFINYALMVPHEKLKEIIRIEAMKFNNFTYIAPARLQSIESKRAVVKIDKEVIDIKAEYFVGAEGRRSPTREKLGLKPKPKYYNHQFLTVTIPRPDSLTEGKIISTHNRFLGLFPLPNQEVRTVYLINHGEYPLFKEKGLAFLQNEYKELAPELTNYTSELNDWSKIQLMTPVMYHTTKYVEGNIAIIGDAAHAVHPMAGQGMNLAMQDADILGELLTSIFRSQNNDRPSLKAYEQVRRKRNESIIKVSNQSALLYSFRHPFFQKLRVRGMQNLGNDPLLGFKQMLNISGLGLWHLSLSDYLVQAGLLPARKSSLLKNDFIQRYLFDNKDDYPWKWKK